jgi:hypothetical protein
MDRFRRIAFTVLATTLPLVADAGPASAQNATAPAPAATIAPIAPSHRQAVLELLQALHMDRVLETSISTMMEATLKQSPQLEPYRAELQAFFSRYFAWPALQDQFVSLYAASFTEPEVRALTAFYRSPVGQKSAELVPQLMQAGAAIGQRQAQEHLPELEKMIGEKAGQATAPPTPAPPL